MGLLYAVFYLKEIKVPQTSISATEPESHPNGATNGVDNMAFSDAPVNGHDNKATVDGNGATANESDSEKPKKKNFCVDFFDPTLALACLKVVKMKREHMKHVIIWSLVLSYVLIIGTAQGIPN